jgi:hypothetical protein
MRPRHVGATSNVSGATANLKLTSPGPLGGGNQPTGSSQDRRFMCGIGGCRQTKEKSVILVELERAFGSRLQVAARCAVGSWFVTEQGLNNQIESATNPNQLLRGADDPWFDYWSVRRTFRVNGNRDQIRLLLFNARHQLAAAQPNGDHWQLINDLADQIQPMNCNIRPTSLVSKFAFSCCPTTFVPYDNLTRTTLKARGHRVPNHNYVAYMNAFLYEKEVIANDLAGQHINAACFRCHGDIMPQPLFELRTADWYLLLATGQYSFRQGMKQACDWANDKGAAVHLEVHRDEALP